MGVAIGLAAYFASSEYRSLTLSNLKSALGAAASARTRHYIARHVFMNLGKTLLEWFVIDRYSAKQLKSSIEVKGLYHLNDALKKGKGVLALSAHFGNWEVLAMGLATFGFEGAVLARQLRYPEYESFFIGMRKKKGVDTFARGSVKEVARLLNQNKIVGLMPDQDMDNLEGVFVDFFGKNAYTPVGPAALSIMTGAAIVPCFAIRSGHKFQIIIEEPVEIERTRDRTKDMQLLTQKWSVAIESMIRRSPENWVWMHERWKTRPKSETLVEEKSKQLLAPEAASIT